MANTSKFDLHNRLLDGRLPEILVDLKTNRTVSETLFLLRANYHVDISDETLRRWLRKVGTAA